MKKILLLIVFLTTSLGQSQNLLTNGDFENGNTGWAFGSPGVVSLGEAFYSTANAGGDPWGTELKQTNLSFINGSSYTLSFRARAAANRTMSVNIQNTNIWNDQFRNNAIALTTTMTSYSYTFSATSTNNNAQLNFHMANMGVNTTEAVYIDDVVLVLNGGGGPTPPSQPVGLVANSPTSSSVFFACGPNNAGSENIVYRLFYSPTATAPANPTTATEYIFGSTPGDGNGVSAFGFVLSGLNSGTPYTFWLYQYDSTTALFSSPTAVTATTTSAGSVPQPVGFVSNTPQSTSMFLAVGPNNLGGDIVYRLFYSPTATAPANPLTATQHTFGSIGGDGNGTNAFGFRLTGLSSSTPYTFWLYQYNTATAIYSLPATSFGTTSAPPVILVPPTTNAPVPTRNAANVVSVFSNTYSNIATNYNPDWGQSGFGVLNQAFEAVPGSGNTILHYANFNFQGTEVTATNLSSMEFLHVDLWTQASTSSAIIKVSPINSGTGPSEVQVTINHTPGQWTSVDIPKSAFGGQTWDNVIQMIFAANGPGSTTPIDIYVDNVYFWNNPGVNTDATLSDLQVDSATVSGFSSSQFSYTYEIPFGTTEIPQITSATPNAGTSTTQITQASALPGSATVVVSSEDPSVQLTYTVNFSFPPPPAQPVGFVAINPTTTTAFLACGPNNVDGNIVYRLFYSPTASAPMNPTTATEYVFGTTAGDGAGASPFGFNLPGLTPSTNYTFWLYQFNIATNQFSAPGSALLTTLCLPVNWYNDVDGDGYGVDSTVVTSCNAPSATYVLVGGDCDDSNPGANPGLTEVPYDGVDNDCVGGLDNGFPLFTSTMLNCGTTLSNIGSVISCVGTANVAEYKFEVTGPNGTVTIDRNVHYFSLTQLADYQYATTYSVRVMLRRTGQTNFVGYYSAACSYSTPPVTSPVGGVGSTQLQSYCGETLPTLATLIATTSLPGVTGYRFRVTNTETGVVQSLDRTLHWFSLTMLNEYHYGTTYLVDVAVKTTAPFPAEPTFGAPCEVTTPALPGLTAYCDQIVPTKTTNITTASLNRATLYRFEVTHYADETLETILSVQQVDRTQQWFTFNLVTDYVPNGIYGVRVSVMTSGSFPSSSVPGQFLYGDACVIYAPSAARETTPVATSMFEAVGYPNPYDYEFGIKLDTTSDSMVSIKVYDMIGKLIEQREVAPTDIPVQAIGERFPTGVYNVVVSQDGNAKSLRMIKR